MPVTFPSSTTTSLMGLFNQISTPAWRAPAISAAAKAFPPAAMSFLMILPPTPWTTRLTIVGRAFRGRRPIRFIDRKSPEVIGIGTGAEIASLVRMRGGVAYAVDVEGLWLDGTSDRGASLRGPRNSPRTLPCGLARRVSLPATRRRLLERPRRKLPFAPAERYPRRACRIGRPAPLYRRGPASSKTRLPGSHMPPPDMAVEPPRNAPFSTTSARSPLRAAVMAPMRP